MKTTKQIQAELDAINRIKHMLAEESVLHLVQEDGRFADFIGQIYGKADEQETHLINQFQ